METLDEEGHQAAKESLTEDEYALFQLLLKKEITRTDREKLKLASRSLLDALITLIGKRDRWTEKEQTQAVAKQLYEHVWNQSTSGHFGAAV